MTGTKTMTNSKSFSEFYTEIVLKIIIIINPKVNDIKKKEKNVSKVSSSGVNNIEQSIGYNSLPIPHVIHVRKSFMLFRLKR